MAVESFPPGRKILAIKVFSNSLDYVEGDDEQILDQTGNTIIDHKGRVIYTDE